MAVLRSNSSPGRSAVSRPESPSSVPLQRVVEYGLGDLESVDTTRISANQVESIVTMVDLGYR